MMQMMHPARCSRNPRHSEVVFKCEFPMNVHKALSLSCRLECSVLYQALKSEPTQAMAPLLFITLCLIHETLPSSLQKRYCPAKYPGLNPSCRPQAFTIPFPFVSQGKNMCTSETKSGREVKKKNKKRISLPAVPGLVQNMLLFQQWPEISPLCYSFFLLTIENKTQVQQENLENA